MAAATLVCQVGLLITVRKRREASRSLGVTSSLDLSQIVRISIFNLWELIGLVLSSKITGDAVGGSLIGTSFLATVPLTVCIIFGAKRDILGYWGSRCRFRGPKKLREKTGLVTNRGLSKSAIQDDVDKRISDSGVETVTLVGSTV
ncbi:hypothetical protein SISNIDRAFT_253998 [Sistotremastrum niveocremeum HHB9708]|uniref:Uncharacterized protein n=1 Tax=Sistotremastrum niveocremeum HHB9708 TaxID=1314777 RepID=A0A164PJD7_9AGAM|nr:hypothetical protein SISNIDRAFT_253998 [Sistotremastrum niveocremeum HHB9708]